MTSRKRSERMKNSATRTYVNKWIKIVQNSQLKCAGMEIALLKYSMQQIIFNRKKKRKITKRMDEKTPRCEGA